MMEVMDELAKEIVILDPLLKHKEELTESEKAGGSLVCRSCRTVALWVLGEVSKADHRVTALNLRGAGLCLLVGRNTNAL